jgi:hypothetical protein
MRHVRPVIPEQAERLKQRLQRDRDRRKPSRLPMRDLLASGQAPTRQDVAQRLGVHRHSVGHGLARDARGGLESVLDLHVPAGTPLSLPPDVLAALAQARRQPAGLALSEAVRPWVQPTEHLDVTDHTLDTMVRTKLNAKLTGPRPRHTKNP